MQAGPLLGEPRQGPNPSYQTAMSKQHYSWMADHVVQKTAIVPAAGYIELLLEAFPDSSVLGPYSSAASAPIADVLSGCRYIALSADPAPT